MALKPSAAFKEARCSLFHVFDTDPKPTLVIDLSNTTVVRGVPLEFANNAFACQYGVLLRNIINGQSLEPELIDWLRSPDPRISEYHLDDNSWTSFILEHRWKIVDVTASRTNSGRSVVKSDYSVPSVKEDQVSAADTASTATTASSDSEAKVGTNGYTLTVPLPNGLTSLGSAPTPLDRHLWTDFIV